MHLVYVVSKGAGDPTLASVPIHLAVNGSLAIGDDVSIAVVGDGTDIITGDILETLEGVGVPPLRELAAKVREHEVPVFV